MRLIGVPAPDLDPWLPRIAWHLEQFAANGQFTPADFISDIRARDRQLWVGIDDGVKAVALTMVLGDRLKSVSVSHACGESPESWLTLWDGLEAWARDIGARRIETLCRPGWERVLKGKGLRKSHVLLEKRL